jgi:cytosine deaminase
MPARCIVQQGATPYEVLLGQMPVLASVRDGQILVRRKASQPEKDLML